MGWQREQLDHCANHLHLYIRTLINTPAPHQSIFTGRMLFLTPNKQRQSTDCYLWSPCVIRQTIIFLPCGFYLLSFFFLRFSSPNLRGRRLDVYHTSTRGVALVRIWNACLKCAARCSLKIQDAKIAILAPSHNFVGLYLRS